MALDKKYRKSKIANQGWNQIKSIENQVLDNLKCIANQGWNQIKRIENQGLD